MALFTVIYTALAFLIFWLSYFAGKRLMAKGLNFGGSAQIKFVTFHRLLGFFLFGIVPVSLGFFIFGGYWQTWGFMIKAPEVLLILCFLTVAILVPFNLYVANTSSNQADYPQMRVKKWTPNLFLLNAGLWILYLLGYEFVFRGFMFFTTLAAWGFWPAILLNSLLYGLVHIPKSRREVFGSFALGAIFCLGCYYTGGFWFAFFAHTFQAVFNEYHSIKFNPAMDFKKTELSTNQDRLSPKS